MRALTVRQPWAEAIACGAKTVENRTMGTRYRGPLAIHAATTWSRRGTTDPRVLALWTRGLPPIATGAVIAVAELVDVHPDAGCCEPWGEHRYVAADGRVRVDIKHWVLEGIRRLAEPLPAKGRLGLWKPDDDLAAELDMA